MMVSLLILIIFVIFLLINTVFIVKQQQVYIIERLGKYYRTVQPGIHIKIPFVDRIATKQSLKINQLDVRVESKTKDNVFVVVPVSVQYRISQPEDAYYKLSQPVKQIESYVYDRVRSVLAQMMLDEAFANKDDIANAVEATLLEQMNQYGFVIINTLITDIDPDAKVKESMNSINAAQREREAAISLADADKIKLVKAAEADAESKRLQGIGIAEQRKAIVDGLVEQFEALQGAGIKDEAQEMLLLSLYFETLQEMSKSSNTQTIFVPSNPEGMRGLMGELRNTLISSGKVIQ